MTIVTNSILETAVVREMVRGLVRRFVLSVPDYETFERAWFYLYQLKDVTVIGRTELASN